ncbi:hypothetical protein [Patulibacter sp. SYSU D01012]|uniref:hypothetical protein n=1 Tax=Patulibacter sp. SYSU D01012 TaxID=2817381 RepID=UPI001B311E5B|nr:hypothetical protein [Patulibacter sp. SYSU D01012]
MPRRLIPLSAVLVALLALPAGAAADRPHPGTGGAGWPWPGATSAAPDAPQGSGGSWPADATPQAQPGPNPYGGGADGDDASAWPAPSPGATDGGGPNGANRPGGADGASGADDADAPAADPSVLVPVPSRRRTVPGRVARVRTDGRVAIPRAAPATVKRVLSAANRIIGKPYKWGGGHGRLVDSGYDCSGAVSYALIRSGLLGSPMTSGLLARWGRHDAGRWIAVYATSGHVYMEVAGVRLDTSPVGDPAGRDGVRWRPLIGRRAGFHTRHPAGL